MVNAVTVIAAFFCGCPIGMEYDAAAKHPVDLRTHLPLLAAAAVVKYVWNSAAKAVFSPAIKVVSLAISVSSAVTHAASHFNLAQANKAVSLHP